MTLKETVMPPSDHVMEARQMAEKIYSKPPSKQIEMVTEIKKELRKRLETSAHEIKEL